MTPRQGKDLDEDRPLFGVCRTRSTTVCEPTDTLKPPSNQMRTVSAPVPPEPYCV